MSEQRLIDANALKERLAKHPSILNFEWNYDNLIASIIDNAPTVNLEKRSFIEGYKEGCEEGKKCYERPQGEWILQYRCLDGEYYTCSQCGRIMLVEPEQSLSDYPFCHCGADMRKPNCVTCGHFGKCDGCEKRNEE